VYVNLKFFFLYLLLCLFLIAFLLILIAARRAIFSLFLGLPGLGHLRTFSSSTSAFSPESPEISLSFSPIVSHYRRAHHVSCGHQLLDHHQGLKEKKEVVEEAENGRDTLANGIASEENGEEAGSEGDEEEEEEEEEDEDDDIDTKKQKTDGGD
jgi:hypothetical protein